MFDAEADPYCYPGTTVLKNTLRAFTLGAERSPVRHHAYSLFEKITLRLAERAAISSHAGVFVVKQNGLRGLYQPGGYCVTSQRRTSRMVVADQYGVVTSTVTTWYNLRHTN